VTCRKYSVDQDNDEKKPVYLHGGYDVMMLAKSFIYTFPGPDHPFVAFRGILKVYWE
jgi:hypothetical protein